MVCVLKYSLLYCIVLCFYVLLRIVFNIDFKFIKKKNIVNNFKFLFIIFPKILVKFFLKTYDYYFR